VLQHVTLEVPPDRLRDCVRFWELLGFTELEPPPSLRDRFTWVGREGTQVHLQPVDEPVVPRSGHAAIVAGDAEAAVAALRDAGFDPQPGSNAWDAPRWFVRDPAGHRVEIMSAAPPSVTVRQC
jgi:catechol 2,3-dioxygenase-like lactoylglutathione lyase family enzyme